jgi:hypothetical protein
VLVFVDDAETVAARDVIRGEHSETATCFQGTGKVDIYNAGMRPIAS